MLSSGNEECNTSQTESHDAILVMAGTDELKLRLEKRVNMHGSREQRVPRSGDIVQQSARVLYIKFTRVVALASA